MTTYYSDSDVVTTTTDPINGLALFDPADPETTYEAFLYTDGSRQEVLSVATTTQEFTSRVFPEVTFSGNLSQRVSLTIVVPFEDSTEDELGHDALVTWLKARLRARKPVAYRDNRGRYFEAYLGGLTMTDTRVGTNVTMTLSRISYGG